MMRLPLIFLTVTSASRASCNCMHSHATCLYQPGIMFAIMCPNCQHSKPDVQTELMQLHALTRKLPLKIRHCVCSQVSKISAQQAGHANRAIVKASHVQDACLDIATRQFHHGLHVYCLRSARSCLPRPLVESSEFGSNTKRQEIDCQ